MRRPDSREVPACCGLTSEPVLFSAVSLWGFSPISEDARAASIRCRRPSTSNETNFGPLVKARELLEPEGRWQAAHRDLVALYEEHVDGGSGALAFPGEYLVALGRKT